MLNKTIILSATAAVLLLIGICTFTYTFWGSFIGITITYIGLIAGVWLSLKNGFYTFIRFERSKQLQQNAGLYLPIPFISLVGISTSAVMGLAGILNPLVASGIGLISLSIYPAYIFGMLTGGLAIAPLFNRPTDNIPGIDLAD